MTDQKETVIYSQEDIDANKTMGIIAYFIFFVPLLVESAKNSPYAKFHANQSLLIVLAGIAVNVIGSLTSVILIGLLILPLGGIAVFVLWVMGLLNAINGVAKPLPLIGGITLIK
jgi:uncharacterized membrane protein